MEFVIISGLSGAGKSRAASIMEDMGFFCVDNLPAPLIPKFAELGMAGNGEYDRVVLVTDIRGGTRFDSLFQALDGLRAMQCAYSILFMEATDEVIIQRYKETRRSHPLADECDSLEEAIALFPKDEEVFVIGGAQIYAEALPLARRFYLTRVFRSYEGDTRFPAWDEREWWLTDSESFPCGEEYPYPFAFETWERP